MKNIRVIGYLSFFAGLFGFFYLGQVFLNFTPSLILNIIPTIVTLLTAIGAFNLVFRESEKLLFIRMGILGIAFTELFLLIVLIPGLITAQTIVFLIYFILSVALILGFIKLTRKVSPKFSFVLEFLVVGMFISSWYASVVTSYCMRSSTSNAIEACTSTAKLKTVIADEVSRIGGH